MLPQRQLELQRRHDLLHDLILQGKDVLAAAGHTVPPTGETPVAASINWAVIRTWSSALRTLPSNTYCTPSSLPDLLHLDRFALVGEGGVAGDDKETRDLARGPW